MEDPEEYVDFMARYRDWVTIKRMGIRSDTKPEEIVFHLAGISSTIENHSYRILGIDTSKLDALSKEIASEKGRGTDSISSAIGMVASADVKRRIREACPNDTAAKLAAMYVTNRVLLEAKTGSRITQEAMAKLYPELKLKVPKQRGRKKNL